MVIDNMGPVNPLAKYKGGFFPYGCKITDDYMKMKEVYVLRNKSDTTEAVHTYNMCVTATGGYRIEIIRRDKGGENTESEFRDDCKHSPIKLEYAATNTRQQRNGTDKPWPESPHVFWRMEIFCRPCGRSYR